MWYGHKPMQTLLVSNDNWFHCGQASVKVEALNVSTFLSHAAMDQLCSLKIMRLQEGVWRKHWREQ